jgi:hypothetical protein
VNRNLDVQGVVREVFQIYRDQAAVLLPAAAIIFLVTALIGGFLLGTNLIGVIVLFAIQTIAITIYAGMVVNLVRDVQDGRRDSSVADLFKAVLPVLVALLVAGLLRGIGVGIGFALLIIPGLFLLTIWAVVPPVVLLERPGVLRSFGRSWELVRGNFWPVFGAIVIFFLISFVVSLILSAIGSAADEVGSFVASFIASVLTAPLSALVSAVLYFHLFATKEGAAPPAPPDTTAPAAAPTSEPTREHQPPAPGQTPQSPPPTRPQSPPESDRPSGPQSPPR